MPLLVTEAPDWTGSRWHLLAPLLLTLWIAWGDVKTRRIPNYLTLGTALAGLTFNLVVHGWDGLVNGFLGMFLGFGFLIIPYVWGGMGAGDVKALAALGAWLGPWQTLWLCCYMGIAGGLLSLVSLWWQGLLWQSMRRGLTLLVNFILCRPWGVAPAPPSRLTSGVPYGVAIALGMVMLVGVT